MTLAVGTNSCSSARRFGASSALKLLTPVRLPPGRFRLATRPSLTGSKPTKNTIGMAVVTALAAMVAAVLVVAESTVSQRRRSRMPNEEL